MYSQGAQQSPPEHKMLIWAGLCENGTYNITWTANNSARLAHLYSLSRGFCCFLTQYMGQWSTSLILLSLCVCPSKGSQTAWCLGPTCHEIAQMLVFCMESPLYQVDTNYLDSQVKQFRHRSEGAVWLGWVCNACHSICIFWRHKCNNWATSWQNQQNDMCTQRRLRSA